MGDYRMSSFLIYLLKAMLSLSHSAIYIYTKYHFADLAQLHNAMGADRVTQLHNVWPNSSYDKVLLTFKSQFIVSAKQTTEVDKSIWEQLKSAMEEKTNWEQ
jgi:hypothetical protein